MSRVSRLLQGEDKERDYTKDIEKVIKLIEVNYDRPMENVVDAIQVLLLASTRNFYSYEICEEIYKILK